MLRSTSVQNVLTDVNQIYNRILPGLEQYDHFVLTALEHDDKTKACIVNRTTERKVKKIPSNVINPVTGEYRYLSAWSNPDNFMSAMDASERLAELYSNGHTNFGMQFILTPDDPFVFIDYDDCYDSQTGQWSDFVTEAYTEFYGAGMQQSYSGKGMHIIGTCNRTLLSERLRTTPRDDVNVPGNIELYFQGKAIFITGLGKSGSALHDCTEKLTPYVKRYGLESSPPPEKQDNISTSGPRTSPVTQDAIHNYYNQIISDLYTMQEGERDKKTFTICCKTMNLYVRGYMSREQVKAGIWHIVNNVRTDWNDLKETDIDKKLDNAERRVRANPEGNPDPFATDKKGFQNVVKHPANQEGISFDGFLTPQQQMEYFKGCYYLSEQHRVLIPDGRRLKPDAFTAQYGGYQFGLNGDNSRKTDEAFKAFTRNQAVSFPKVADTCFKPRCEPFQIIDNRVNAWIPPEIDAEPGNVQPFVDHIYKLLPGGNDARILLTFMQSLVRNPGVKFQWAPVLQGTEGNGKTLITRVLSYAVGERYTHLPKAAEVSGRFNDFVENKLFICVEEIMCSGRREVLEILKDVITNERVEVEGKGISKRMIDNASNWMFMSNHKDGVPKTKNDRRYAIFYTAQQTVDDINRDGMTVRYFKELYDWLDNGGYKYVAHWLKYAQLVAPEYDPAGECLRAPETTSTLEAIKESYGPLEQEIIELIEQDTNGFRGGWISSNAVSDHFKSMKKTVGPKKISELIENLGYVQAGRATKKIDRRQPRLYRRKDLDFDPKNYTTQYLIDNPEDEDDVFNRMRDFKNKYQPKLPAGAKPY